MQATMNDHFRDTVFGQLVRLFSGKILPKFPNELDPNLWKQCVQQDATPPSSISGLHSSPSEPSHQAYAEASGGGEKGEKQIDDVASAHGSGNDQNYDQDNPSHEKSKDVILVGWYGPDDQEV
jgi:DHA1 family multidrug resistance protein-like MFS transporter